MLRPVYSLFTPAYSVLKLSALFLRDRYGQQRWSQIAKGLPGRSDSACRRRWIVFPPDRFAEFRLQYEASVIVKFPAVVAVCI